MKKAGLPKKSSPKNTNKSNCNTTVLCPRLERLAKALLARPRTVSELARRIPTNNPPEYVRQLRHEYGLTIFCEPVKCVTVDGFKSWYGRYHLTTTDRKKLERLLGA